MTSLARRSFITGLGALFIAAPAIVRASSLDMVRGVPLVPSYRGTVPYITHPTDPYPPILMGRAVEPIWHGDLITRDPVSGFIRQARYRDYSTVGFVGVAVGNSREAA